MLVSLERLWHQVHLMPQHSHRFHGLGHQGIDQSVVLTVYTLGPAQSHRLDAVGRQTPFWALPFLLEEKNLGHPHPQTFHVARNYKRQDSPCRWLVGTFNSCNEQAKGGQTWDWSFCWSLVRLQYRRLAGGPDTGKLTCYCPWAFKHCLVWSGRRPRAQMKANIVNTKEENEYLQQKMSQRPL